MNILVMQRLRSRLPPVNAVITFEAAARYLSFTKAATELGVTREAVSRQIRRLERHLGVALFIRHHRTIKLSSAGREFSAAVHPALEAIAHSAGAIVKTQAHRVTVTATVAIASYWLTPRLPRFRRRYPRTEIRVVVSDSPPDLRQQGIDLGLRYGDGVWPELDGFRLFGVRSFPVCACRYAKNSIKTPNDLVGHTLLNLDGVWHRREDWLWWLQEAGIDNAKLSDLDIVGFDNYANVIQAAIDGQGIALGFSGVIDDLLESGCLVRAIPKDLDPGHAVYLVKPHGFNLSATAKDFYDWIIMEAAIQ